MLRIGPGAPAGVSAPMPQPETQLPDPTQDPNAAPDPDADGDDDSGDDSQKIDPSNAGYQGPDQGPFICANCIFFENNTCEVVAGPIDHMGCCNNFTSASAQGGGAQGPQDQSGGNTSGDQSNGAQGATDQPTVAQDSLEGT